MSRRADEARQYDAGISYVEVLIATALIALAMVPAIDGLQAGLQGAEAHVEMTEAGFHLASALEEVLAQPFASLDAAATAAGHFKTPTSYSDALGSERRRLVYLWRYDADDADGDGDRFTGGEDDLLWVRVELENTSRALETLTAR